MRTPSTPLARNFLVAALLLCGARAGAATPPPPAWDDMLETAKGVFQRHREDQKLLKMVRSGEPQSKGRRTPTEVVPQLFQNIDVVYETKKWKQVEKQTMTLHYESGLGGWSFVGYQWGDEVKVVRPGNYPRSPPAPTPQEITDAVKMGMREWHVRADDVEKVQAATKGGQLSWLDDVPTAGYSVLVRVSVRDVIDSRATYGKRYKTRFVCEFKAQLALEDNVSWTMSSAIPDCATDGCTLARMCKDTWPGGKAR